MAESESELFKKIRFYAVGKLESGIKDKLVKRKAKAESYLSALATHAIVSDPTHYEAEAALDVWQIPAVTPRWVELSVQCKKLLPTDGFSCSLDQIFSKCVICCSGLPKQDKEKIWALVTYHGGQCQAALTKVCTHLVLPVPEGAKYEEALKHEDSITCVAPDWILDSVKEKKQQDVMKYHPKLNVIPEPPKVEQVKTQSEAVEQSIKDVQTMSVQDKIGKSPDTKNAASVSSKPGPTVPAKENLVTTPTSTQPNTLVPSSASVPTTASAASTPKRPQMVIHAKQKAQRPDAGFAGKSPGAMQQTRYSVPPGQPLHPSATGPRFYASPHPIRNQLAPGHPMMMSSVAQSPSPQVLMSSHQMVMSPMSQPQTIIPGVQGQNQQQFMLMSPPPKSVGNSRRGSSGQSGGSKKKKTTSQSNRISSHAPVRPVHTMNSPYQGKAAQISPQQQQLMMGARMPVGMDQNVIMTQQKMGEMGQGKVGMTVGPRPGMMPGQYPTSPMMTSPMAPGDNYQNMQHHQIMQMQIQQQQQQQMQRMNMMRQTSPGAQAPPQTGMEPMQQAWPRAEGPFTDPHQVMFPAKQHAPNAGFPQNQMIHQQPQMPGQPQIPVQPQGSPHQAYNPMMMNRMPGQSPSQQQQQQYMFSQRSPAPTARYLTSSSLEAAGMAGISPIALQQGLLNTPHQDQPPLIHPSLQGTLFPKETTSQQSGGSASKKRSKTRRKTETSEEDGRPRARSRTTKAKKPPAVSIPNTDQQVTMISGKLTNPQTPTEMMMTHSPFPAQGMAGRFMVSSSASYQPQGPVSVFGNLHPNTSAMQIVAPATAIGQPPAPSPATPGKAAAAYNLVPDSVKSVKKAPKADPVQDQENVVDPLELTIKEMESAYQMRDPSDDVPQDLFLLGCIFCICEYDEVVNDQSVLELWKKMIVKYGGVVEESYTASCTHVICVSCTSNTFRQAMTERKRCVSVYWLNDVLLLRTLRPPWLAVHLPTLFSPKEKPAANHILSYTGFHTKERERIKMMAFVCGAKFTGHFARSNTALLCKRPKGAKFDKAREWMVPCATLRWLRDILQSNASERIDVADPKYQMFENETETTNGLLLDYKKSQPLLDSWKTPICISQEALFKARVKRKLDQIPQSPSLAKCPKMSGPFKMLPRICFTGFAPLAVQDMSKKLETLECRIETTFTLCTHLVAKQVSRTVKFLSCISSCSHVVTPGWVEESFKFNMLLDEDKFHLHDKSSETKFKFSLLESLRRAKQKPLFRDCLFAITAKVTPDRQILRQIIECAGGRLLNKIPSVAVLKHLKEKADPHERIFILSCPDDNSVYMPLKKEGVRIHNPELVLTGVLKQEINPDLYRL